MEKEGKPPQLIMTILDRGGLNTHDTSTRISRKAMELKMGETAFFFDRFERPIQVTIIEQGDPGSHVTVRNNLCPVPHDDILIRSIESHRLFTVNMTFFYTDMIREEIALDPVSKSIMNWGLKNPWNPISNTMEDTTSINPSPPPATQTATDSGPLLGAETTGITALAMNWTATARGKESQEYCPREGTQKKRPRKVMTRKIMVILQNFTFPCSYSDRLTPATLLEDISKCPRVTPVSLTKVILTSQNCPSSTLNLKSPLSQQGICQGDTLIMLVRQAKVHDPYDVQHLVVYQEEDVMQYFLTALLETSSIPPL